MGVVYEATQEDTRRSVALKVVSGDSLGPKAVSRFRREAEAVGRLNHPNIVKVYEAGDDAGTHFLAMELIPGRSLERIIADGRLPFDRAARVFEQAADALQHAHDHGILHRDVKPANLMITDGDRVLVTDFGLARDLAAATLTASGAIMGTPMYMPPEQAEGKVDELDARSDVYALGASLYEALTGKPVFQGDSVATIIQKVLLEDPYAPRAWAADVPRELEWITLKALRKEKDRRYATAGELRDDLRRFLKGEMVQARPTGIGYKTVRMVRRNRVASLAIATAVLALAAGGLAWRVQAERARARVQDRAGAERQRAVADPVPDGHALRHRNAQVVEALDEDRPGVAAVLELAQDHPGHPLQRPRQALG